MCVNDVILKRRNKITAIFFIALISIISSITILQVGKELPSSVKKITDRYTNKNVDSNLGYVNSSNEYMSKEVLNVNLNSNKMMDLTSRIRNVIARIESKSDSFIFMKSKLARFDTNLNFFMTRDIRSSQVLYGKNNWLFYKSENDGDSISDYLGINYSPNSELKKIADNIVYNSDYLENHNIQLFIMILPNKEQIYHNFMPSNLMRESTISRTDKLVEFLKNNIDVPIIYPKNELLKYAEKYQLYYQYDTHWNQLGAFIAEQQLLFSMFHQRNYIDQKVVLEEKLVKHESGQNDLANMIGMEWYFNDAKEFRISDSFNIKNYCEKEYFNENSTFKQSILYIGDSFRIALLPHLVSDFSEVHIIHRQEYNKYLIEEIQPDFVIVECVERYSNELSTFDLTE